MNQKIDLKMGDCLEVLKTLKDNSVDSVVTDPPAGIGFMGKSWDSDKGGKVQWIAWLTEVMSEVKRVLKPGAHGLIWALPRTSHWTAHAIEDAGFEIRDVITHVFGTGFPKSLDISKAIDKAAGANREVTDQLKPGHHIGRNNTLGKGSNTYLGGEVSGVAYVEKPATLEAKQWQGFGTALKPASEHWLLCRKPLSEKTVVANVLKHGCGGINIDASRVSMSQSCKDEIRAKANKSHGLANSFQGIESLQIKSTKDKFADLPLDKGRFPANFILSHNPDCKEVCSEAIYFDVALANEVACALIEKEFQGSQGDCLSYRRFYGELFRLVSENAQCVFPSPADVHAFFCYILNPLAHNQKSLEFFHLSSLGDLVRYYNSENTLMNKSFSTAYLDETLSDKLHSGWIQAFLENPNNTSSGNIDEAYSREKSDRIVCSAEKLKRLYFLNTCLASDLNQCFTRVVCSVKELDSQSGISKSCGGKGIEYTLSFGGSKVGGYEPIERKSAGGLGDVGGASRFFYCAKSSKSDRNEGLEGMPKVESKTMSSRNPDKSGLSNNTTGQKPALHQNHHPTVKSTKLMSYLITMITPLNGVVLDPFMGSGSTGCAAIKSGFRFIGIEKEADYFEISKRRIESI